VVSNPIDWWSVSSIINTSHPDHRFCFNEKRSWRLCRIHLNNKSWSVGHQGFPYLRTASKSSRATRKDQPSDSQVQCRLTPVDRCK
jgi:hypothetical protein